MSNVDEHFRALASHGVKVEDHRPVVRRNSNVTTERPSVSQRIEEGEIGSRHRVGGKTFIKTGEHELSTIQKAARLKKLASDPRAKIPLGFEINE